MDITKKMERWIETRLWNQKVKNEPLIIKHIHAGMIFNKMPLHRKH